MLYQNYEYFEIGSSDKTKQNKTTGDQRSAVACISLKQYFVTEQQKEIYKNLFK
jgi:hypothetical protein